MLEKNEVRLRKLKEGNISLILDSYDDIFSDFDPRPYTIRALSDDFLIECKKATADKDDHIELRFQIPYKVRDHSDESKIKRRLKDHFTKHYHLNLKEARRLKRNGMFWILAGTIVISFGAFLMTRSGFLNNILITMAEPAGWFFFWEGLGKIFIHAREKTPDVEFNRKMSHADIIFIDY